MKNTDKKLIKIQDNKHKLTLDFSVADAFSGLSAADKRAAKALNVVIEASHAGIINGNQFFYLPKGMANGAKTFVEPFQKPVLVNHDIKSDPIGRILSSEYKDYGLEAAFIKDSNHPVDALDYIMDWVKGSKFKAKDYKGLGHLELEAEINDAEAIQKILDKRYLTVSIGGACANVTCSRCGADIKEELTDMLAGKEVSNECNHMQGFKYSDSEPPLFYIAGDMEFDEVSYVTTPADPNAVSRVANSKKANNCITICDIKFGKPQGETIYFHVKTKDEQESVKEMKTKLKDFLAKAENTLADVKQALTDMGLKRHILSDEKYASLRKTSYLFADEKILPILDKAHILAAYAILETLEDEEGGKTLSSAQAILDAKATRILGDGADRAAILQTMVDEAKAEDAKEEEAAKAKVTDEVVEPAKTEVAPSIVIDYAKLAVELSKTLTDLITKDNTTSYEFLLKRQEVLEKELEDALGREKEVTDSIKNIIIDHILTIDQTEAVDKLQERTLDSLKDKLKDLKAKTKQDTTTTVTPAEEVEGSQITDANASPGDAKTTTKVEDDKSKTEGTDKVDFLDSSVVRAEYRNILKTNGLVAAGKYLDELRKTNKVPKGFRLN